MAALAGSNPSTPPHWYLECQLLIQVRNFIVHTRPEHRSQGDDGDWPAHTILQQLATRKIVRVPSTSELSATMNELQNPALAEWAYLTMVDSVQGLLDLFPETVRQFRDLDMAYGKTNLDL